MYHGADPLRQDEIDVVRQVLAMLQAQRRAGEFDPRVIVASPQVLGLLREEMPASPKPLIRRGIGKNLAGVPEAALPEVLRWRLKPKSISI